MFGSNDLLEIVRSCRVDEPKTSHSGLELTHWYDISLAGRGRGLVALSRAIGQDPDRKDYENCAGIYLGGWMLAVVSDFKGVVRIEKDGTCRIDRPISSWDVVLVDDVYTTGASLKDGEAALAKHGITVVERVVVLDRRGEFPDDPRVDHDLEVRSLFTSADLEAR